MFRTTKPNGYSLYGFVNQDGVVQVEPVYSSVKWYVDGYILVKKNTIIGELSEFLELLLGGNVSTCLDKKFLILDQQGNVASLPNVVGRN